MPAPRSDAAPKSAAGSVTPGQIAYEIETKVAPFYEDGGKRPTWGRLSEVARASWEKYPTPRQSVMDWGRRTAGIRPRERDASRTYRGEAWLTSP
ncbi:MAG: hypothetical protein KGL39_25255 [Patescibacteria group bacterium]|nr:hypothetical protein [Patescibacteria group bacterium]